jgi:ATP-binding cassette subfamily B protein
LGQTFGKYEASMAENIAYGDWDRLAEDRDAIEQIASLTGLNHISDHLPAGLDTELGREFSDNNLSAGQWQLLAIARTLARNASVVILDEPTSNIDVRSEYALFKAIEQVTVGVTTIIISHRFSTIRMMDRILVMHEGRIVEQGSHDELMSAAGRYKSLYTMHEHYRVADKG